VSSKLRFAFQLFPILFGLIYHELVVAIIFTLKTISIMAKYSKKAQDKVHKVMHEYKSGDLKSSSGRKVTSRKQAIAIGISEAREQGAKVPPLKNLHRHPEIKLQNIIPKTTARKSSR
jgi:hypothetical protein